MKSKKNNNTKKIINIVQSKLDIPDYAQSGVIVTQIIDNNKIKIEGKLEIAKYDENIILLKSKNLIITIKGVRLEVNYLILGGIIIKGTIISLEYFEV